MGTVTAAPGRAPTDLPPRRPSPVAVAAVCGVAATAATLGLAELLAGLLLRLTGTAATPSPLLSVGGAFVDRTPAWLKDWAVATFGTADKAALGVGIGVTLLLVSALLGVLALRSRTAGLATFVLVGLVGAAAVASRPSTGVVDVVPTLLGLLLGTWVLRTLLARLDAAEAVPDASGVPGAPAVPTRRAVLLGATGAGGLGLLGAVAGQALARTGRAARDLVGALGLPTPTRRVSVPAAALSPVEGQTPFVTPNADFYRIDTALFVPRVDPTTWRLRVTGLVDQEVEIDLEELLAQEHVEALVTLTCVSNTVGGGLAGNAVWTGWPVRELLARAGVAPGADMVLSRSVDGFTAGTPLEVLTDDRDALIAVAMNGEPLPAEHGYPVRLVVPGLYGYVSATKWLTELRVTRFDADEGYWTPRGWSALGPVKTASRIDVPRTGQVRPGEGGTVTVAGVAWAQHRGISSVEVRVDDGEWAQAELLAEPTVDAWRLWRWEWDARPGEHVLTVRATDGEGRVQTQQVAPPAPDGASGWHAVRVDVA